MGVGLSKGKKSYKSKSRNNNSDRNSISEIEPKRNSSKPLKKNSPPIIDDKYIRIFEKYSDEEDENVIGPEGVLEFLKDIELDPESIEVLVLAYYLNSERSGYFEKEPFCVGLKELGWDSISKIKSGIAQITKELDEEEFKKIYKFAFNFAKEDNTQKNLTLEIAISMLQLVLKGHAHVESFSQFLNEQSEYKAMNIDQWMSFYEFSHTVSEDFSNYDENAAWPVLLDLFVEWSKENRK